MTEEMAVDETINFVEVVEELLVEIFEVEVVDLSSKFVKLVLIVVITHEMVPNVVVEFILTGAVDKVEVK
jgi:hypothetical protein